jgi:hypothetical protein
MVTLYVNYDQNESKRRELLFQGELLLYSKQACTAELCDYAQQLILESLSPFEPEIAQNQLDVSAFIERVAPLKTTFTNSIRTKELVRAILETFGYDLSVTYFDVPRLRVVPSNGFLTAGVSYTYKAYRDTWYASPACQINYWMPVFAIDSGRAMSIFPAYWNREMPNSSGEFDYGAWCAIGRKNAVNQTKEDTRKHPLPLAPVDSASEVRIAGTKGDVLLFSASHLHATAPNNSGKTRFSIDFRTVHLDDLCADRGAPAIDARARGTTLGDFLRASDFTPLAPSFYQR